MAEGRDKLQTLVRGPVLNLNSPPDKLQHQEFWRLAGVDGRYKNTARRFPGFSRLEFVLQKDSISRTVIYDISASNNFYLFKYIAIQKGNTDYTLRGWLVAIDDPDNNGEILLILVHFDTQDGNWYTYKVESPGSFTYTPRDEIDAAVAARNLYISIRGKETIAIRWSYLDTAERLGQLTSIVAGPLSTTEITDDVENKATGDAGYLFRDQLSRPVRYGLAFRWYSPTRGHWSQLETIEHQTATRGSNTAQHTEYVSYDIAKSRVSNRVGAGYTQLWLYRTIANGGTYYLEQIVQFQEDSTAESVDNGNADDKMPGTTYSTWTDDFMSFRYADRTTAHNLSAAKPIWSLGLNDTTLVTSNTYNPFSDESGATPAGGLLTGYQDMLIMKGPAEDDTIQTGGSLRWSSLYHQSPENFPPSDHIYSPSSLGHQILALVDVGDYAFAVRDDAVVRIHRNGPTIAINELYRRIGGVSRYGVTGVGQSLFMISTLGLLMIDGTSGRQDIVGSVDQLITDPTHYWRKSLDKIALSFDSELGAICLLNTEKEEIYWIWHGNGNVTSLQDAPFGFVNAGPHPRFGGQDRTWWLGPNGGIFFVNYDRTAPRQTMCGASSNSVVNGKADTVDAAVTDDTKMFILNDFLDNAAKAPACEGFYVYMLNGDYRHEKRKVASVTTVAGGDLITLETGFPDSIANGTHISIAPVVMKLAWGPVRKAVEPDLFSRTVGHALGASIRMWGGETNHNQNLGLKLTHQFFTDPWIRPHENDRIMRPAAAQMWAEIPVAGETIYPGLEQYSSDVDFEVRAVQTQFKIDEDSASVT